MTHSKELTKSLDKVIILLEQLEFTIEERNSLVNSLNLTPSTNDNYDLVNLLTRIVKLFDYIQSGIDENTEDNENFEDLITHFGESVSNYTASIEKLEADADIDINEYKFEVKITHAPKEISKSVRFRDNLVEYDEDVPAEQTNTTFAPYRDDASVASSFDNVTNQQLFAEHQQLLLNQDDNLDNLHKSIQIQHSMGLNINRELDDHLILLNDLEQGVDDSHLRLNTATNRLNSFRKKVKENGNMTTIIVLLVILILLLVVLN